jgi:hypothetical protein
MSAGDLAVVQVGQKHPQDAHLGGVAALDGGVQIGAQALEHLFEAAGVR